MSLKAAQQVTINSRKFDGTIRRSWNCELIEADADSLVFVGVFDIDVSHPDLGEISRGTISYEYYWLDRWYNIFCFHEPDGSFRNYYCNINMPPTFVGGVLNYIDLDIDVVVWPDMRYQILDRDEFEQNAAKFNYSEKIREMVEATLAELIAVIKRGDLPTNERPYATNIQ